MTVPTRSRFSRRRFLGLITATAALALLPGRAIAALLERSAVPRAAPVANAAHASVAGLDGIHAVGLVYLTQTPGEATVPMLRELLGLRPTDDPRKRPRRLQRRIARDFGAGEIVSIDGWRMARSEARWAALLHLERAGRSGAQARATRNQG